MRISFNAILIPVDFTVNTEVAIKKALALSEGVNVSIHLLHVFKPARPGVFSVHQYYSNFTTTSSESMMIKANEKLDELKMFIGSQRKDIHVSSWLSYGIPVQEAIIQKAKKLNVDLIVIGKNSHHSLLPFLNTVAPNTIALRSGIAVFTVKPGSLDREIKTIVIPIGEKLPQEKLAVLKNLRRKFKVRVNLVAFAKDDKFIPAPLFETYRFLQTSSAYYVSYKILTGSNEARTVVKYCERIGADILIVYPETETRVGWMNIHLSDILSVKSRTQILAVHPS